MGYSIVLPGGMQDFELEAYFRALESSNMDIASTRRVLDPETNSRWVASWESKSEAELVASALRRETENDSWQVMAIDTKASVGPLGPIEISVSERSDGFTYSLTPSSRKLISKRFPTANVVPSVFVARSQRIDLDRMQGSISPHVSSILTGLTETELSSLGGCRLIDPRTKRILVDAPSLVA